MTRVDPIVTKPGFKPDFRLFTAPMEFDPKSSQETPIITMVGSSTHGDMQGDIMTRGALEDMTRVPDNLSVWLNHSYSVPEDIFGSLLGSPRIKEETGGIADLHLRVAVATENPRALQTLASVKKGRLLGCSVGCMVKDFEFAGDIMTSAAGDRHTPIKVLSVYPVEWSIVGIPANQRSWVENAINGVFQRTLDPRLAPAVKSLFPKDFERTILGLHDETLKKSLLSASARPAPLYQVLWEPKTKSFYADGKDGKTPLTASEVSEFIQKSLTGASVKPDAIKHITEPFDGHHSPFTGTHSHPHRHEDGTLHDHEHYHENDADHEKPMAHPEEDATAMEGEGEPMEMQYALTAEEREEALRTYHELGELLGVASSLTEVAKGAPVEAPSLDLGLLTSNIEVLTKTMASLGIPELKKAALSIESDLKKSLKTLEDVKVASREAEIELRKQSEAVRVLKGEAQVIRGEIQSLRELPLGRPTQFVGRSVKSEASYSKFLDTSSPSADAEGMSVKYIPGVGQCQHWKAGYKAGERPELTANQMSLMSVQDMASYTSGGEALVPDL